MPLRQPLFAFAAHMELQSAINPVNALYIPRVSLPTKDRMQRAISVLGILFNQLQKLLDNWLIPIRIWLVLIDRSADLHCFAGRANTQVVLLPGKVYQFPFLRRL